MSILVTADLHFSDNPRDYYRFKFFDYAREFIEKHKVRRLLILGDLTEVKDRHGSWLVNRIADEMHMLASWCPITILRGNHDGIDPDLPFYTFLRHIKDVDWIRMPNERTIDGLGRCLLLPHTSNYKEAWQNIDLKKPGFDYIFAHNTFKGATGQHVELDGIPTSVFRKDSIVIAGDVHVPHTVGPVTYVGAPYLIDFGDDYRPRMLLIKKDGTQKSIAVPGPQKRVYEIRDIDDFGAGKTTGTGKIIEGDILKVKVTVTAQQYTRWAELKRAILLWGKECRYVIDQVVPVTERTAPLKKKKSAVRKSSKSDDQIMQEYATARGVDSSTLKTGTRFL